MLPFTLIADGNAVTLGAIVERDGVWVRAPDIEAAMGWELKPEGLCRGDVSILVTNRPTVIRNGTLHLETLARLLNRPIAISETAVAAYMGPDFTGLDATAASLIAPDFALPDLDGREHKLSEHRGSKVLLAAWASW